MKPTTTYIGVDINADGDIDVERLARAGSENDYCTDEEASPTTSNEGQGAPILGLISGIILLAAIGYLA